MKLPSYNREDIRSLLISLLMGILVQILAYQYIKRHPELFTNENEEIEIQKDRIENKKVQLIKRNRRIRNVLIRGGWISIGFGTLAGVLKHVAENGALIGLVSELVSTMLNKIPKNKVSTYFRQSLVQLIESEKMFPNTDLKEATIIKLSDVCDKDLTYLFEVVKESGLSSEQKERITRYVLGKYFDLKLNDYARCTAFLACLLLILLLLFDRLFYYHRKFTKSY